MSKTPEHWQRYASLAALIRGECCGYRNTQGVCGMLARECEVIEPTSHDCGWRSPMSKNPKDAHLPEPRERSGHGRCTWFQKALLPVVPGHLADECIGTAGGESHGGRKRPTRPRASS